MNIDTVTFDAIGGVIGLTLNIFSRPPIVTCCIVRGSTER